MTQNKICFIKESVWEGPGGGEGVGGGGAQVEFTCLLLQYFFYKHIHFGEWKKFKTTRPQVQALFGTGMCLIGLCSIQKISLRNCFSDCGTVILSDTLRVRARAVDLQLCLLLHRFVTANVPWMFRSFLLRKQSNRLIQVESEEGLEKFRSQSQIAWNNNEIRISY